MNGFNPAQFALSGGLGAAGAGFGQLFGSGENPGDAGMDYLNQIQGMLKPYYQPYINAGGQALSTLQNQFGNLLNNPTGMMNRIGSTFQQSPGYQFQTSQALGAANRAAAAGGMAGSPMEQQNIAGTVNNLANQDYYNYLNHGIGMYDQGLQGMQGINQMGFNATSSLTDNLMSALMSQAQMAYAGAANQNQTQGGGFGSLIGGAASAIPFL
jgi:hypothetical protein